ncbi:MAG TPA: 3-oxo-5-alpha-steroid 4-dehydrogenase [Bacteroidales bacterium]|nr:3-oxo-5-alpha-steroid 4-dehydrogenase [Bacteroidales bacterium]
MINNRLGWFLMELPALVIFGYFLGFKANLFNMLILLPALLWGLHYTHRVLIYPLQIRTVRKKIPVIIALFAFIFNIMNGFLNGYWFVHFAIEYRSGLLIDFRLTIGVILFLTGFVINKYHDSILIKLRSVSGNGYKIPYSGLFKYVSCPNFLGEIISWTGFALVAFNLPALSFLIWTLINLTTRTLDHHRWYIKEFPEYSKERKAIIPYLL